MKNVFVKIKEKLVSLYGKNKRLFIITLALIVVVCACFLLYPKQTKTEVKSETKTSLSINRSYAEALEDRLETMLLSLTEINKANVLVVCDETEVVEYLKNKTETIGADGSTKTITEEVVYEKDGSSTSPIIVSKTMPKIVGVWVIINSVSASTKLAITNSIISVLNIPETSISILQER